MNKIYKVIWSKAKHTYVVASEIAKGHTKGETTGRGLKKLAAAMLVAAALLSPSFAWAADTVTVNDTSTVQQTVYTKDGADNTFATKGSLDKEAADREAADTKEAGVREAADTKEAAAREAADTTLQSNIDKEATAREVADTKLQTAVEAKANAADVYSKTDTDTKLADKANAADVYSKTDTDTKLADKANAADVYSKTDTDTKLADKVNVADVYSKTDTDTKLADKANAADVYSKTDTDTKLADKANTADVYSKTDADAKFATNDQLQKKVDDEKTARESADSALDSRTSALEAKTGSLNRVAAANSTSINESMTYKGNQYSATLQVNGSGAQIGAVNNSMAGLANDGGTAYTEYRARTGAILSTATNDISSTSSNGQVVDTAGDTTGEYSQAATKSTGTTFTYSNDGGKTSSYTTIKGNSVSTGTVSATAGITDETTKDGTSVIASQTVGQNLNALDERITNVKEYVLSETNKNYVSKDDAAVQDGAIVKADKTIGENVTNLDAALAKETAARIGADKAQDEVIKQVNQNVADGFNTINQNMANGFKTLNEADAKEAAERKAADGKLVDAVNSGLSLSDDNVLQKNTTAIDDQGNVSTSKTDANEMILNKGKDNQITLNEKGIKVGTNSTVVDKDGVYTGGDTYSEAKAAMSADGKIKGANGAFTVDENGNVASKATITGETVTDGKGASMSNGTVTGKTLTDGIATITNGNINTSGTITGNKLTDGVASLQNGNLTTTGNINAHAIVATGDISGKAITGTSLNTQGGDINGGAITGTTITGTTGTFGSLTTTGNASVGGTLSSNGLTNTGNATTDTLKVNHNATVGGDLAVTGDITGKSLNVGTGAISGGQITGTGLNVGAGTIKTTGAVETGTLETTGNATIGGDLTVDKDLTVNGTFDAKTLSSTVDANNYTTITGGKTQSVNKKEDAETGEAKASASTFDENGSNAWAKDDDSIGKSSMTADKISQSLSDKGDNPKNEAFRVLSQNKDNKYEITDSVVEGNQSNVENRTADTTDSQISFKDDSGKVLNKSYITQNLKKVLMGVEEGDNKTTIEQDANNIINTAKNGTITNDAGKLVNTASNTIANMAGNDITNTSTNGNIANTAANGTISNNAKNLTNTASENITNKAENGNISNIASNGTISNEAKTISNKADEALTNDAKTITNTASESVTTQIGNGSEVQSVMNASGIANKATGKSITNDAATITNTGTTSVTNQVGENKVLVDTTHVQSAFGDTIYTTWAESGITNNATDKTVATNAKDILNTATGDITNTAKNGTITNDAGKLVNTASDTIANMAGNDITNTSTNGNIANTAANGTISNNAKNLTNTASENITNKAENGNISNIASNGTISNEAKTISNKADEALTNDAKTITNTASESVTTQIGNGSEVQSVMNASGIANKAAGKSITNDAATITNTGTISVTNQVGKNKVLVDTTHVQSAFGDTIYTTWNESGITDKVGENVERTMGTKKIEESVKDAEGNSNTATKTADKDINVVTDGTNTSTESQLADSVNTSLKVVDAEGKTTQSLSNVKTVSEDTTKITDTASGAFSSSSQKADSITSTVKDTKTGTISERSQTVSQVQDKVGTTTVTTTDGLTKLTNEAGTHNTQMDFAEVLKDLGVRGNAVVDGTSTLKGDVTMESNASVGKNLTVNGDTTMKGNASVGKDLTVTGTSTLTGDVTMKSNATVEKDLTVNGKSTLKGGLEVSNGTITDTLKVTGSSEFGGAATFNDIVTMNKGLSVTGGVTADTVTAESYTVKGTGIKIDENGINAGGKVIKNVGQGDISEGSHDAVSGGQLYETNTRVSGLETRMGTVETKVDKLDNKIDKVGANAAAMANLHPLEFDEDSKWNIAAAVGSSGSETASAVGVFYRPNENVMVNASAAMGTGENMFGGGVSLRLGHGGNKAKEAQMKAAAKENRELRAKVDDLTARMDALLSVLNPNMSKDFPDVPENHWAYEAVSRLAGNGIVEGYEDGKYHGERQMTRYEMAEIIYNALSKGAKAEKKLVEEFRPELQAMAAQKKA